MKSLITLVLLFFAISPAVAQNTPITSTNNHEVGIDISPFLQRFVSGNSSSGSNTIPFYLMYRYHFDRWAIRAGIGGSFRNNESIVNDTMDSKSENSIFNFRLGVEGKIDIYRRWQFFYGVDLYTYTSKSLNQYYFSVDNFNKNLNSEKGWGAAPLMGLRFKISDRISVTTETSLIIYYFKGKSEDIRMPSSIYDRTTETEGWKSNFTPPTSILFTFNF